MYFIFQFRGKFIGGRVSELKRTFCCVLWRFFFCCMTLVGLGRLFIVGVYRVFLQS